MSALSPLPALSGPDYDEQVRDRIFVTVGRLPHEPQWQRLRHVVSPSFAAVGWIQGRTPQQVQALGEAVARVAHGKPGGRTSRWTRGGVELVSAWTSRDEEVRVAVARFFAEVDWVAAGACLDAGLDPWMTVGAIRAEETSRGAAPGFDAARWTDVGACVLAGMTVQAAVEHVHAGAEMAPVRLVAALTG